MASCMRRPIPKESVKVWKEKERPAAHYSGLQVCGSVWVCPICAAKVTERRRVELRAAVETWKAQGGRVALLTTTVPHYSHQRLPVVLKGFEKARVLLRNRPSWKTWAASAGLRGSIRCLEVTHGANGWHVHAHELLFLDGPQGYTLKALEGLVQGLWRSACVTAGLGETNGHGARLEDGAKAARYVGKWGLEEEMTKGHVKHGRAGNLTPWDLLREVAENGEDDPAELFREYAKGFKGRRQLTWSRGLRDLLGLDVESTDEELAQKIEEGSVLLGSLTSEEWAAVLYSEKRGELLEVAVTEGWAGVLLFVSKLKRRLRGGKGREGQEV